MSIKATKHLTTQDRTLGKLISRIGPCTLEPQANRTPYESLVRSVVYQQLNGKAASTILGRFIALFPKKRFPTPQNIVDISEEKMRGAGLSAAKTKAIKDIASHAIAGKIPTNRSIKNLSEDEIIERLLVIRGVGRWTIEMMLIFKLGRQDVLPTTDYGVRKGFALTFGWDELPTPKELDAHGLKWSPFRSIAAWYLWRALDEKTNR